MRKLPNKVPVHFSLQFPGTPLEALDVLRKMLEIHPGKRMTVDEALRHPFFAPLHNPNEEPVSDRPFDFSFENEKLHRVRLQELIWEECGKFRPSCLPVAPRKGDSGSAASNKKQRKEPRSAGSSSASASHHHHHHHHQSSRSQHASSHNNSSSLV